MEAIDETKGLITVLLTYLRAIDAGGRGNTGNWKKL